MTAHAEYCQPHILSMLTQTTEPKGVTVIVHVLEHNRTGQQGPVLELTYKEVSSSSSTSRSTWWCRTSSCRLRCSSCSHLLCRITLCVRSEPRPRPLLRTPGWTHTDNPPSQSERTAGPNLDLMDTDRQDVETVVVLGLWCSGSVVICRVFEFKSSELALHYNTIHVSSFLQLLWGAVPSLG